MDVSDLDYEYSEELIAQRPADPRDHSRLMYVGGDGIEDLRFYEITDILKEGDVLVKNKTKVVPARVPGRKPTGGKVEILLYHKKRNGLWKALVKGSNIREGMRLKTEGTSLKVVKHVREGRYLLECQDGELLMQEEGMVPTPPYIKEPLRTKEDYQTVYAKKPGSVAAPTAGFHFTKKILEQLSSKGVGIYDITLHVGPGTFLPLRTEKVEQHRMEEEFFIVDPSTAEAVTTANSEGRRLVLVGTTTVRALESVSNNGKVSPGEGWTDLFIYPGYRFRSGMNMFLTNFHLPRSTPLLLTCAFGGKKRLMKAYERAVNKKYRFYSFGDSMLLEGNR
ncbi:MAG: tRNA preQ1(34) S-adenosylmethionine ribosyltransferase-isomerase QueA [Thermoplasmata archaeon]